MRILKATTLAAVLSVGAAQALPLVDIEVGALLGADIRTVKNWDFNKDTDFTFGAYGRIWLKSGIARIAPFVKWESISGISLNNLATSLFSGDLARSNNIQYGAVLGLSLGQYFTPYVGVGYSQFTNGEFSNTWALNYGLKFKVFVLPIAIGVDGSWQRPKVSGVEIDMHRVSLTLGLQF